jgi:hypothetical protein
MTSDEHKNFAKETFARCWDLLGRSLSNEGFPDWLKASLNEGVARAYAAAGDHQMRDTYLARALTDLERESDTEDAELIRSQIEELLDD